MASEGRRAPQTVWFIMVDKPGYGWTRVGRRCVTKECARSWVPFVKAWHGLPTKVVACRVTFDVSGKVSARTKQVLDSRFNTPTQSKGSPDV